MKRIWSLLAALVVLASVAACVQSVPDRIEAESLVDRSRWSIERFQRNTEKPFEVFRAELKNARGVLIMPDAFKGAFLFGAAGGHAVLLARTKTGGWSYPAFYTLGGGSFGLQIGAQSSEIVLVLRTEKAVQAILDHQGKFGADLGLTVGTIGAGIEGSTTAAFGADVVGFTASTGLFAGLSLEGAALVRRNDLNAAYYGSRANPADIIFATRFTNAQADPLRTALAL